MSADQNNAGVGMPVYLPTTRGSAGSAHDAPPPPTPFQMVQTAPKSASFLLAQNSYFRSFLSSSQSTPMSGSTTAVTLEDGLSGWVQLDFDGNGNFREASFVTGDTAPYESNGGKLATFTGGGIGPDDPFVQDQAFTPVVQAFAADPSGDPTRGGVVYDIDDQGTQLEVVQLTCTHLAMRMVFLSGVAGQMALPDSGPLIS